MTGVTLTPAASGHSPSTVLRLPRTLHVDTVADAACDCASRCPARCSGIIGQGTTTLASSRPDHASRRAGARTGPDPIESAQAAGLRYVSDTMPGIGAEAGRQGLRLRRPRRQRTIRTRASSPASDRWPFRRRRPTSGSAPSQRPHPGHRPGRARPEAVPLPPAMAGGAGRDQVRPDARVQRGAAADPRAGGRDLRQARAAAREGARHRGAAAREHRDPGGQRRVRAGEPLLRAHHAARPPRGDLRDPSCGSSSGARAGRSTRSRSPTGGSPGSSRAARTFPGEELFQYLDDDGEPADRSDSGDVNEYLREIAGAGVHRQGLPHLGRHGAGGRRAAEARAPRPASARRSRRS